MSKGEALDFIISRLIAGERNLDRIKRQASKEHGVGLIKNPEILAAFPEGSITPELRAFLLKKPAKTLSGVTPVAVMIRPQNSCRHACIYCPSTGLAAKSYVGYEPAALRGRQYSFDSFEQVKGRVEQYESGGHPTDKCEMIVMGGTFLEMEAGYKASFIKGIYDSLNGGISETLDGSIRMNETARRRAVGLTIETRPDVCIPYIDEMLSYGATRVELGVQHPDDDIYRLINRGHTVQDVLDSTKALKDSAFKVCYHIMPGLPGSDPDKDIAMVEGLFSDPGFRPDMLKIYPTLVIEGTGLHELQKAGGYEPYDADTAADVISEFFRHIPAYVRVMRIQRDIPAPRIGSGVKKSNLRELVDGMIARKGIVPKEIRSREARARPGDFSLERLDYEASGGQETFLSFEDDGLLAGFLRLRLPAGSPREQIGGDCALVRELHIYGQEAPLRSRGNIQHSGFGSRLLQEAEDIAREKGGSRMLVISGVGVREYYRRHGYNLDGPYMEKKL